MSLGKNQLFYGDNYEVLQKYIKDESVDLVYIDPPFNSKRNYNQIYNNIGNEDKAQAQAFVDTWSWDDSANIGYEEIISNKCGFLTSQSIDLIIGLEKVLKRGSLFAYLVSMTLRINEMWRVLKPTGSFYLHCDPTASHYLKLVCDALFTSRGGDFRNEITWKRTTAKSNSKTMPHNTDIIFFYTKSSEFLFKPSYKDIGEDYQKSHYRHKDEEGRLFRTDNLIAPGKGYQYEWNGITKSWRCPKEKMQEYEDTGRLYYTKSGTAEYIRYLDESKGVMIDNCWIDIKPINSQAKERLGYPTQKPEALLERIIKASSNEGDTILDAYCGCGTTVAVAQKLNRNWIGVDITYQSISLIIKRLEDTIGKDNLDINEKPIDQLEKRETHKTTIQLSGVPQDFEGAIALANKKDDRVRKEFEKWAVLTFSNNRATINEKKGGDGGIDGIAYIMDLDQNNKQSIKKILFSVKSNKNLTPSVIRDLNGTIEREDAAIGYLITLYPMENLVKETKKYGVYQNRFHKESIPKIEVITIEELLQGKRMINSQWSVDVVKSAVRDWDYKTKQKSILDEEIN